MKIGHKLAKRILEVVPPSMARIREELRSSCAVESGLSVPQLRVLGCLHRGMEFVGDIAKYQGVSQPAMSKMVDVLVEYRLVVRQRSRIDRRQVPLKLSKKGAILYAKIRASAEAKILKQRLPLLKEGEQVQLFEALELLEKLFQKKS